MSPTAASLNCAFYKNTSAMSAQAESEQTGGMKHGYPVAAVVSRRPHNCSRFAMRSVARRPKAGGLRNECVEAFVPNAFSGA